MSHSHTLQIARQSVESKVLKAVGYHPETQTLAVDFQNGGSYHYTGVPADVFAELLKAESIGKHFHQHIRGVYAHERVPAPGASQ